MHESRELLHYVQSFFQDYALQRGLRRNTILAYRDVLKLFLAFAAQHMGKRYARINLEDLKPEVVLAFLQQIEFGCGNSVATRNHRLAALRTFFAYLTSQDPLHAGQYQRIIAIPAKRTSRHRMDYLELDEVKMILDCIDRKSFSGRRDYALFNFLYNTGARVQEVTDLKVGSVRLTPPLIVTLSGKGAKTRQVPLWPETANLLRDYLTGRGASDETQAWLFVNARGQPLTRFGVRYLLQCRVFDATKRCPRLSDKRISPHTFRHTTAMHLLQAGVDLTVIKEWLGHVYLATTHAYVEIDLEMKRKALASCTPIAEEKKLRRLVNRNQDVIAWLESL